MAITLRAAGTVVSGAGNLTLVAPAGTVSTDVVLACFAWSVESGTTTITPPSGWTLVNRTNSTGEKPGSAVYWALGSVASYAFTITLGTGFNGDVGFTLGYIGVDNTTPMDATAVGQANASSTTITAPSITTVTNNAMLVGFFSIANTSTFTAVFGTKEQSGNSSGHDFDAALGGFDAIQATAGASGTNTETASVAETNIGILSALRPAAGAATVLVGLMMTGMGI